MKFAAISILLLITVCTAQSVPVVALSSVDVAKVKQVHQAMLDAEKAWSNLQSEITNRYLIVDKDDPDASTQEWYPREMSGNALSWLTSAQTLTLGSSDYRCETAEEKKVRTASEDKWRAEEKQREEERESKSRRYRKGWTISENCVGCGTKDFEYSSDWKYLIPKPTTPTIQPQQPWIINPAIGTGTSAIGGLLSNQNITSQ